MNYYKNASELTAIKQRMVQVTDAILSTAHCPSFGCKSVAELKKKAEGKRLTYKGLVKK